MNRAIALTLLVSLSFAATGCGGAKPKPAADAAPAGGTAGPAGATTSAAPQPAANAPVLALMRLNAQDADRTEADLVGDMIRDRLMAAAKYRVVDREQMKQVLANQAMAMAGMTDDTQAANVGKLLSARYIGVGTYGQLLGSHVVSFRIVDVESGQAITAGSAEGQTMPALEASVRKMVAGL